MSRSTTSSSTRRPGGTKKAITQDSYGQPDVLALTEIERPVAVEVLVRVRAVTVLRRAEPWSSSAVRAVRQRLTAPISRERKHALERLVDLVEAGHLTHVDLPSMPSATWSTAGSPARPPSPSYRRTRPVPLGAQRMR